LRETVVRDLQLNDFFSRSIDHLTKNLEYYPGGITYNHVVNNLKGILTAAIVCIDEVRLNVYSALFFQELAIIVGEDGILREESSHYQFIVTRWICEIEYLFMKAKYKDGSEKIAKYSRSMLAGCHFFLVIDKQGSLQIQMIGDISPDFDPDWIIDYVCGCYKDEMERRSYGHLILAGIGYTNLLKDRFEGHKTLSVQSNADVTRVIFDDTDIFICHAHKQGKHYPNHAHDDFGSYILFFNGKEFIGDRGRINYKQITESKDYMLSEAYNVISINNFPIIISEVQRHFFPPFYLKAKGDVNVKQIEDFIEISVSTNAVKCIKSSRIKRYERIYSIRSNTITISDHLYGTGNISVKGQIILHPSCDLAPSAENSYLIRRDGLEIDTSFKEDGVNVKLLIEWYENQEMYRGMITGFHKFMPETTIAGYQGYIISKGLHLYTQPNRTEFIGGAVPDFVCVTGKGLVNNIYEFCKNANVVVAPGFSFQKLWR
jgi:hypothetical protein